jgi:NitT/TauT family transport system substrate-binding protein
MAAILALTMLLALAACGGNASNDDNDPSGNVQSGAPSDNTDQPDNPAPTANMVTVNGFTYDDDAFKAEEAANRPINLSYGGGSLCTSPYALAYFLGYYEDEGLEVNIMSVESDKEALASGKIDGTGGFMASWLPAISNGVGFTFTTGIHTGCGSCVVLTESEIQEFSDAAGATIAVSGGFGSGVHNYGMRAVIHEGMKVEDYEWINFDASLGLEVLKKGDAQILVGADQMVQKWIDQGAVRRIHSNTFDPDFKDEPCCVFGLSTKFIEENPICAEKVTRAAYRAALWVDQNDENKYEAVQILADNYNFNVDPDYAVQLMKLWKFGVSNEQCEICLENSTQEYVDAGIIASNVDIENLKDIAWKAYDLSSVEAEFQ